MSNEKFDEFSQDAVAVPKNKMTVEKFFQQFNTLDPNNYGSWPLSVKISCWIFIVILVFMLIYFALTRSTIESISQASAQEQNLLNEFREKESKLRNLQQYQIQLQEMEARFNQQLEQLPKETEIPGLVLKISVWNLKLSKSSLLNSPLRLKRLGIITLLVLLSAVLQACRVLLPCMISPLPVLRIKRKSLRFR